MIVDTLIQVRELQPGMVVRLPNHHPSRVEITDVTYTDVRRLPMYMVHWRAGGEHGRSAYPTFTPIWVCDPGPYWGVP